MTTGYSGTPLVRKLGIKAGHKVLFVNQPDHYLSLLDTLPEVMQATKTDQEVDFIHLFAPNYRTLDEHFQTCMSRLTKNGSLWVSWPKKAAKTATDLDSNVVRNYGLAQGLVDVKVCAVDETWSALKFMYRVKDR